MTDTQNAVKVKVTVEDKLQQLGIEYQDKDKYYTNCPKCEGHKSSLLVTVDDDYVRYRCMREGQCIWNKGGYFRNPDKRLTVKETVKLSTKQIIVPDGEIPQVPDNTTLYKYKNTKGETLFIVARLDNTDGTKAIYPIVYHENKGFAFEGYKGKSLYGAETLKDFDTVIVVEGEKTADAARKIFTKAAVVTWPGGCNGVNRGDWDLLKGKSVVLWPDNDEPGVNAMQKIAGLLTESTVSIIDVSSLEPKQDLADNIGKDIISELYAGRSILSKIDSFSVTSQLNSSAFIKYLTTVKTGDGLGWDNIDKIVRLPQSGLVVIGGRTGHGKTSLMTNLAVNALVQTTKKVMYYSYEIPAQRLLLKLLMTKEAKEFDDTPYKNYQAYVSAIKEDKLQSWKDVSPLLGDRLFISDANLDINNLVQELDQDAFDRSFVLLDYIQLIPAPSGRDNRYLTIKNHADSLRAIANKRNMVIVTGSQLTSGETPYQDSVREGKDITNAAELELKVWNKKVARVSETVAKNGTDYYDDTPGDFVVSVTKDRNGIAGVKFGFNLIAGCKLVEADKHNDEPNMEF